MLLQLIDTLTSAEKRFLSLNIEAKTQHAELYRVISKQKVSKNKDLLPYLSFKVPDNLLTTLKNQLYNLILESLTAYNKEEILEIDIKKEISMVEILYSKKLLDQALKKLNKIKQVCLINERLSYLLECLNLEIWISFESFNSEKFNLKLKELNKELRYTMGLAQEQYLYKLAYVNAIHLIDNQSDLVNPNRLDPSKERNLILDSSKYYYEHTRLIWSLEMKDYNISKEAADNLVNMVAMFPNELQKNQLQYVDVMFACAIANSFFEDFESADFFIEEIRKANLHFGRSGIRKQERLLYAEVIQKVKRNDYDLDNQKSVLNILIDDFNPIFTQRIQLLFCYSAIKNENYKEAKKWSNSIFFLKKQEIHLENFKKAVIADLYLNFVTEKIDLVEKQVAYVLRRLKQIKANKTDIDFFKSLLKIDHPLEVLEPKLENLL